jgi:hypothetical protein
MSLLYNCANTRCTFARSLICGVQQSDLVCRFVYADVISRTKFLSDQNHYDNHSHLEKYFSKFEKLDCERCMVVLEVKLNNTFSH